MKELKALRTRHKEVTDRLVECLADVLLGERLPLDIYEAQGGELLIPAGRKITKCLLRLVAANWNYIEIDPSPIRNRVLEVIYKFENELGVIEDDLFKLKNEL